MNCLHINLGCGSNWRDFKGFDGLDKKDFGQKYVQDLEIAGLRGIEDETVSRILAYHILEHIHQDKVIFVMNECFRVMMKGGRLEIKVPRFPHTEAVADPTHLSFWTGETIRGYFCGKRPRHADYGVKKWKLRDLALWRSDKREIQAILEK